MEFPTYLGAFRCPVWGPGQHGLHVRLLLVLGIVVDDAIVVGENIFQKKREGMSGFEAAVDGKRSRYTRRLQAVLTTMVAFGPLLLVPALSERFLG